MFQSLTRCSLDKSSHAWQRAGISKYLVEVPSLLRVVTHNPYNSQTHGGLDSLRSFSTDTDSEGNIIFWMDICFLRIQCFRVSTCCFPKCFTFPENSLENAALNHALETLPPSCSHWGWSRVGWDAGCAGLWAWWWGRGRVRRLTWSWEPQFRMSSSPGGWQHTGLKCASKNSKGKKWF